MCERMWREGGCYNKKKQAREMIFKSKLGQQDYARLGWSSVVKGLPLSSVPSKKAWKAEIIFIVSKHRQVPMI